MMERNVLILEGLSEQPGPGQAGFQLFGRGTRRWKDAGYGRTAHRMKVLAVLRVVCPVAIQWSMSAWRHWEGSFPRAERCQEKVPGEGDILLGLLGRRPVMEAVAPARSLRSWTSPWQAA